LQEKGYVTADIAEAEGLHQLKLSGTKFRKMLRAGEDIPEWCVAAWSYHCML
jgi:sulfate adenylyltransferase